MVEPVTVTLVALLPILIGGANFCFAVGASWWRSRHSPAHGTVFPRDRPEYATLFHILSDPQHVKNPMIKRHEFRTFETPVLVETIGETAIFSCDRADRPFFDMRLSHHVDKRGIAAVLMFAWSDYALKYWTERIRQNDAKFILVGRCSM